MTTKLASPPLPSLPSVNVPLAALNILRHSIGYDDAGNDRWHGAADDSRRNSFVTGPGSTDWQHCQDLVARGLMLDHGGNALCRGDHCFTVTAAGKTLVRQHAPKPLTSSQRRYQAFLNADSGMSFIEWLKCRARSGASAERRH
jgi:hypothetical protein